MMRVSHALVATVVHQALGRGLAVRFQANGASMEPSLPHGSVIEVRPVDPAALEVGEVVLACVGQRLFCHRLVERLGDHRWVLAGDAPNASRHVIGREQVLGRVVGISRPRRWIAIIQRWWRSAARPRR